MMVLPAELLSANKPVGRSIEIFSAAELLMCFTNASVIPCNGLFNPLPSTASIIISSLPKTGKSSVDCIK